MPGRNVGCNPGAHTGNVPWALVTTVVLMKVTLRATIRGALGRTQRAPKLALRCGSCVGAEGQVTVMTGLWLSGRALVKHPGPRVICPAFVDCSIKNQDQTHCIKNKAP